MRSLKRLVATVTAAGLVAALAVPPVAASPATRPSKKRIITLSGSKSGWTDIHFDSPVQMLSEDTKIKSKSDYAAYVLQKKGEPDYRSGAFWLSIFERAGGLAPEPMSAGTIPPGNYRLYLITEGRSTLRIPVEGLKASRKLSPRKPVKSDGGTHELPDITAEDRIPVTLRKNSVLLGGHFFISEQHQATTEEQCLTRPGANHCLTETYGVSTIGAILSPGNVTPGWGYSWLLLAHPDYSNLGPPGGYEIFQRFAASVATHREHVTFWIQIDMAGA